jgi:hypothetical protein
MDGRRKNYRVWGVLRIDAFIRLRDNLRFRAKRSDPRATYHD